jgi:hypothetical protein
VNRRVSSLELTRRETQKRFRTVQGQVPKPKKSLKTRVKKQYVEIKRAANTQSEADATVGNRVKQVV